ncbi:MAG: 3-hydroxyacyl-CoA dehydrogenase NAD-binding domain-containing protein [Pirellulales bacterium]
MADSPTFRRSFPEPDIVVLTIDMPNKGANVLSGAVLDGLSSELDELEGRQDLAGLILISGKPGQFIAGADLREFLTSLAGPKEKTVEMCRRGHRLFARMSTAPFVTVAAIDGICVGGGAELVSFCDRRVFSDHPSTQLGFPEVKLGIYPGWGGTVRAPRIVGLSNAVEMITSGESISATEAMAMGWGSDCVPRERLLASAIAIVRDEQKSKAYLADRRRRQGPVDITETELGFLGAAASGYIQQQTKGQYPAPLAALETMLQGVQLDSAAALELEAQGMAELFGSPVNQALLNVFFLTDANKKDRGIASDAVKPKEIRSVTVIGAGIMGAGIAATSLKRDLQVVLSDSRADALERGEQLVLDEVSFNRETKRKDADRAIQYSARLTATTVAEILASSDLVIEAVIEKEEVKREVLTRLEPLMRPDAILATNTSTIPVTRLAKGLKSPDRFCGIHFFNPVRKMKLVEVIRGPATSDETVVTAVQYAKNLGKMPVVVLDGPGFLVNRLLLPYMDEALKLLEEGVPIEAVDKAAKRFGMPMGPIELYDMVGLDTALYAGNVLCAAFPDRFSGSRILPALVEAGRMGQKSGRGFFSHQNKKGRAAPDPEVAKLLDPLRAGAKSSLSNEQITDRLFLPMLVEAARVLEEGLVRHARDVDIGMIFGTGFPPFRGGLLFWADTVGAAKIVEMLKPYAALGKRFIPSELLTELARDQQKFYDLNRRTTKP